MFKQVIGNENLRSAYAYINLGQCLYKLGENYKANVGLMQANLMWPTNGDVWVLLGLTDTKASKFKMNGII